VVAGDVLVRLNDATALAQLELARQAVRVAEARRKEACLRRDRAGRQLARQRKLAEREIVSEDVLYQLEHAHRTAAVSCDATGAELDRTHAAVHAAETELAKTLILTPFDGVVSEVSTEAGEWVTPSPPLLTSPPVIDLIDPSSLYVSAPMDEVDSGRIRPGQRAKLTVDSRPGETFSGRVLRIAPYVLDVQAQNRTVEIEVEFDDREFAANFLPRGGRARDAKRRGAHPDLGAARGPARAGTCRRRSRGATCGARSAQLGLRRGEERDPGGTARGGVTRSNRGEGGCPGGSFGRRSGLGIVIRLEDIWRTYEMGDEELHALRAVTERIRPGEHVAIMGPSGSGKSTLLNIVGCLDRPSRGSYHLDGREVGSLDPRELSRIRLHRIGFIFQSFHLVPRMDALANAELPMIFDGVVPGERRKRAMAALEAVGLGRWARHRPAELSGGQKQRVAIARATIMGPGLLLADEPTGNLDTRSGDQVLGLLDELHREGMTLVVVTHDPNVARRADRVLVLRDGEIVRRVEGASVTDLATLFADSGSES